MKKDEQAFESKNLEKACTTKEDTMQQSLFGAVAVNTSPKPELKIVNNWQEQLLTETEFVVLDLETTGLNAKRNAITEVTAIRYKNGEEVDKYSTLVKPTEPITEESEQITGISNEMVRNAPALVIVLSELSEFVGVAPIIVGHNVSFDIGFLREKCVQMGLGVYQERYSLTRAFCTKQLAQRAMPGLPSYEGIVVATACGVHNPNPHRAESDVRMSAGILFNLIDRLKKSNPVPRTVVDLMAVQGSL